MKYWEIHVTYGKGDGDGYSIFLKTENSFDENEVTQEAIDACKFQEPEDLSNIDSVSEITEEDYNEAVS